MTFSHAVSCWTQLFRTTGALAARNRCFQCWSMISAVRGTRQIQRPARGASSATPTFRVLSSTASSDHLPGRFTMRNMTVSTCAYSDRISCNTAHNPTCGGAGGRGCSSPNRCALLQKDFISLEVSSSVWDCRLFRRPAKVLAKNAVFWPGYKKSVWSAEQGP